MGKRGNNEGSIYKRNDGRWVGAVHLYLSDEIAHLSFRQTVNRVFLVHPQVLLSHGSAHPSAFDL